MLPYFVYNGIDSRKMGMIVNTYPPITQPKARITSVTVPGRTGDLTYHEGETAYDAYIKTVNCIALPGAGIPMLCAWLSSSGDVVFGNEPLYMYQAQVINQVDFTKVVRGQPHKRFDLPFYCQPYKTLAAPGANVTVTTSGTFINNPGTLLSRPIITVHGAGVVDVMVGMYMFSLTGIDGAFIHRIDCDAEIVTNTAITSNRTNRMTGDFPRLVVGQNAVSWLGTVTSIVIEPRFRWL